jgi:hypothetical protein
VSKVLNAEAQSQLQPYYRVTDGDGKEVKETFYHHALRQVSENILVGIEEPEKFIIQKILDDRTKKDTTGRARKYLLIKWQGFKEPTWEPYSVIKNDVPKQVANYEKNKGGKQKSNDMDEDDQPQPRPPAPTQKPKGRQTANSTKGRRIQPSRKAKNN